MNSQFSSVLASIQKVCTPLDFRLVGGALTNFITPQTRIATLDCKKHTLSLKNHANPSIYRRDGSLVDIDMICFTKNLALIEAVKKKLKEQEREITPHVSLEPAIYESWGKRKNSFFEFVSGITISKENKVFLTFGPLSQEISWETLAPWTIVLKNGETLTTLSPYAHLLRYFMRQASGIKAKDKEKIGKNLRPFVNDFLEKAKKQGYEYEKEYESWDMFIHYLTHSKNPTIRFKGGITNLYWNTIGTRLAHGKGILYRISTLGDKFTG